MWQPKPIAWLWLAALTFTLVGPQPLLAQDSDTDTEATDIARMRVGHFSPDLGAVDLYINGELIVEEFTYPDLTEWLSFEPGTVEIGLAIPGESPENLVVDPTDIDLEAETWSTITAIGEVARDSLEIHTLLEDYSDVPPSVTRITVFNAISAGGLVDLYADDDLLSRGLAYPGSTGDNDGIDTIEYPAGEYELRLVDFTNEENVFFTSQSVLGADRHYFIVAIGRGANPNGYFTATDMTMFDENMETDSAQEVGDGVAHVRVGHFAGNTEPLDLYLDELLTEIQGVRYGGLSQWVTVPAGIYETTFTLAAMPLSNPVGTPFEITLFEDSWNTITVVNGGSDETIIGRNIEEDYSPIPQDSSRITFFNAIPDAPPLDLMVGDEAYGPVGFPGAGPSRDDGSTVVNVAAGAYDISVTTEGDETVFALPSGTQLASGNHYFIAMIDTIEAPNVYVQAITQAAALESAEER